MTEGPVWDAAQQRLLFSDTILFFLSGLCESVLTLCLVRAGAGFCAIMPLGPHTITSVSGPAAAGTQEGNLELFLHRNHPGDDGRESNKAFIVEGEFAGALATPGAIATFVFDAAPNQKVFFERLSVKSLIGSDLVLTDALGRTIDSTGVLTDMGPVTLMGGTYTLSVVSDQSGAGTFTYRIVDQGIAAPFTPTGDPIALGVPVAGTLADAAAVQTYRVVLDEEQTLYFDMLDAKFSHRWKLIDPSGQPVFDLQALSGSGDFGPITLQAATYTLEVSNSQGDYIFNVHDLPVTPAVPIALGELDECEDVLLKGIDLVDLPREEHARALPLVARITRKREAQDRCPDELRLFERGREVERGSLRRDLLWSLLSASNHKRQGTAQHEEQYRATKRFGTCLSSPWHGC